MCFCTQQNNTIKNCRNDKFIIIQNEQIVNLPRRTQVLTVAVRSSQFHFNLKNEKPDDDDCKTCHVRGGNRLSHPSSCSFRARHEFSPEAKNRKFRYIYNNVGIIVSISKANIMIELIPIKAFKFCEARSYSRVFIVGDFGNYRFD